MNNFDSIHKLVNLPHYHTAEIAVRAIRLTCFVGPSGSGKSTCAWHVAKKVTGKTPVVLDCTQHTEREELFGHWRLTVDNTVFEPGALQVALTQERPLILEEFALLPPGVKTGLMGLRRASERDSITNCISGQSLAIPDSFRCICTSTPGSLETSCRRHGEAIRALLSDFFTLEFPDLYDTTIRHFLNRRFPDASETLVDSVMNEFSRHRSTAGNDDENATQLNYRNAETAMLAILQGMGVDDAVRGAIVNAHCTDEDAWNAHKLMQQISE